MFDKAKWITRNPWVEWHCPQDFSQYPPSPYLAKTFIIKKPVKSAMLNIVGLGQGAYYLNGERIPDSYLPTHPQAPNVTVIYNIYDITNLLNMGKNRLGVTLGNNSYNEPYMTRWRSNVKMIAQLNIQYIDGEAIQIVSDTSWTTADSPTLMSARRCGDSYDATREIEGWCQPDFDDSGWDNATVCRGPGGIFRPAKCPPVRIMEERIGTQIAKGVFDFGVNTSGFVKIKVKGKRRSVIHIKYGEKLTPDGLHVDQKAIVHHTYAPLAHKNRYVIKGDPAEEWEPVFGYHGFQYAEIEGDYDDIEATARIAYTDLKSTASFSCSNDIINRIHFACKNSLATNCHGALTDCPHREQNEWTGDAMVSAESMNIEFNSYDMFYEWMLKFKDDQLPNGQLPCIVPAKNMVWEYNFANGLDWDSAIIHIPYYCLKYSGNPEILQLMWENMVRSMRYFASMSDTNLMCFGVGDWTPVGDMCNKEITDTAYYYINAKMMAEMAQAFGQTDDTYGILAKNIKRDFRKKYINHGKVTEATETSLAITIFSGLLNADEIKGESQRLAEILKTNGYGFKSGIHGLRTIFDALSENGFTQLLFDCVINDNVPGYAQSVKKGLTTLPETFDFNSSLNHHFKSQVDSWFYKYLAGIQFIGLSYNNVKIAPHFVKGIDWLNAEMHGVSVSYNQSSVYIHSPFPFTYNDGTKSTQHPKGSYCFNRN